MTGLGASDPRLNDREWLARMYAQHGDMWIALETGAARATVRSRREGFGIASRPPGRPRGVPVPARTILVDCERKTGARLALLRAVQEARPGGPAPDEQLLAKRTVAYHHAKLNGNHAARLDAAVAAASAWIRHIDQLLAGA